MFFAQAISLGVAIGFTLESVERLLFFRHDQLLIPKKNWTHFFTGLSWGLVYFNFSLLA